MLGDLGVGVSTGDLDQNLSLAGREVVELGGHGTFGDSRVGELVRERVEQARV
jgi:hypothetical protein